MPLSKSHKDTIQAQVELLAVKQEAMNHYREMYAMQKVQADNERARAEKAEKMVLWAGAGGAILTGILAIGAAIFLK